MMSTLLETFYYHWRKKKKIRRLNQQHPPTLLASWMTKLFVVTFVSLLCYASAEKNKHCKFTPIFFCCCPFDPISFAYYAHRRGDLKCLVTMRESHDFKVIRFFFFSTDATTRFGGNLFLSDYGAGWANIAGAIVSLSVVMMPLHPQCFSLPSSCHSIYPFPVLYIPRAGASARRRSILVPPSSVAPFFSLAPFFLLLLPSYYKRERG